MPAVIAALRAALSCTALSLAPLTALADASPASTTHASAAPPRIASPAAATISAPASATPSLPAAPAATTHLPSASPGAVDVPAETTPTGSHSGAGDGPAAAPGPASVAGDASPAAAKPEFLWELDAYYSSAALQFPLTAAPIPDGGQLPESEVYKRLFLDSLRPRVFMLEASLYPLPAGGAWLKENHPDTYDDFTVGDLGNNELNLVDAVTAGFQEPWAVSVFTGSVMNFTPPGSTDHGHNRGYMGYLVSYGAKHIRNSRLIDDDWWEVEWKLKGVRENDDDELSWSFRTGLRNHGNRDIADTAYVALRRSSLNYRAPLLSFLNNSEMSLLTELDRRNWRFLRQELIIGRKVPVRRYRMALSLDLGLVYENPAKYSGDLADPTEDTINFVVRPHIEF